MEENQIRITAEPKDPSQCIFTAEEPLYPGGAHYFATPESAVGSPLAEALIAIDTVSAILIEDEWQMAGHRLGAGVREQDTEAVTLYEFAHLESIGNRIMFGNIHQNSPGIY